DCPCANTLAYNQSNGQFFFTYWAPNSDKATLWAMKYSEKTYTKVTKLWEYDALLGGSASSPDISANGERIYVNDNEGSLHAVDAKTGNPIWKYAIGYNPGGSQSTSPDGYIIPAGANGAGLMCLKDNGDT